MKNSTSPENPAEISGTDLLRLFALNILMKQSEKARKLELQLLKELRKDSSRSISRLARKLRAPITTVFEAEKKLRKKGMIIKYYSALDFEKAGFPIRAQFFIDVDSGKLKGITEMLMADDSVNNIQLLQCGCNIFVEAVFERIGQFFSFSEKLDGIKKKAFYVIEEAKTESAAVFQ